VRRNKITKPPAKVLTRTVEPLMMMMMMTIGIISCYGRSFFFFLTTVTSCCVQQGHNQNPKCACTKVSLLVPGHHIES
jgi:hypothetical protein